MGLALAWGLAQRQRGTLNPAMLLDVRSNPQRSGDRGELEALRLLQGRGWRLLDRQWRCRWGELDLVLAKGERLLLVEVKTRRHGSLDGGGTAALGAGKCRRLRRAWGCWLAAHPRWQATPVEMVAALVCLTPASPDVRWIRLEI